MRFQSLENFVARFLSRDIKISSRASNINTMGDQRFLDLCYRGVQGVQAAIDNGADVNEEDYTN